jgi:DNA/RNA endonuclease YhcR with UshA esterase domain
MGSNSVVNAALIAAGIGLFALFVIFLFAEPPEARIGEADNMGNAVTIKGTIVGIHSFDSHAVIGLAEVNSINAVVFDKKLLDGKTEGQNITVTGRVNYYMGKKEFLVERIKG